MKHILVVDDNKTTLTMVKNVLSEEYKVTAVTMGSQAIQFLEKNTCDMILLDIDMPVMDGFEVMEHIHENVANAEIPIVFLTGNSNPEIESKCLEAGAVDFIAKPFVPNVLKSRVSRILEVEEYHKSLARKLEEKRLEVAEMRSRAQRDVLTDLYNRSYTEEHANMIMKENQCGVLFMLDMDNFKEINDHYGHIAGDNVLKLLANILKEQVSSEDIVGRIGGDEFMVFLKSDSNKKQLAETAMSMIEAFDAAMKETSYETNASISVGIAVYPEDGSDFAGLYSSADKALYFVKQNGKKAYHFYGEQKQLMEKRSTNEVDLAYLRDIMARADEEQGVYHMEYESFHHVYNFIRRFIERSKEEVQTLLFTAKTTEVYESEALESALDILEQAIIMSLRRADVSTRYSSKQVIVILMNSSTVNGDMVAQRIIRNYERLAKDTSVSFGYAIAQIQGEN